MATTPQADISENMLFNLSDTLLETLLIDRTLTTDKRKANIFWATDNYAERGKGYQYNDQIQVEAITGENGNVIVPRAVKSREQRHKRSRAMAEIFTPSWVCNTMVNAIDESWFGRKNVFNTEIEEQGKPNTWEVTPGPIEFPEGKSWQTYVRENRLEITCGEAPFLASRYDTVTGESIPVERRIGILDRKLRIVDEHTSTHEEWVEWATLALKGTYGYEWQGDNLLLARESMLMTMVDYHEHKFHTDLSMDLLMRFAEIISWNIWQMDGLKCVIPGSCTKTPKPTQQQLSLFDDEETGAADEPPTLLDCPGCKKQNMHMHNGVYCMIMDWEEGKPITFVSLIPERKNGKR